MPKWIWINKNVPLERNWIGIQDSNPVNRQEFIMRSISIAIYSTEE